MNYEVQQALARKVEQWEVYDLKKEVDRLRSIVSSLEENLARKSNDISSLQESLKCLVDILLESELGIEDNLLYNLRIY